MPRRPRLTALAFLLLALPMLGVAALAAEALLITAIGRDPFDAHTYFQLCPISTGGACTVLSGWLVLVIGAAALAIGMGLIIAGIRSWRRGSRASRNGSAGPAPPLPGTHPDR